MFRTLGLVAVVACLPSVVRADTITYNARADFTSTANPSGAWSYGTATTLGGAINPFPNYGPLNPDCGPGWYNAATWINYAPCLWKPTLGVPVSLGTYIPGPNDLILHPGLWFNLSTVLRWTAPAAGTTDISVLFSGAHVSPKTVLVFEDSSQLFSQYLNAYDTASFGATLAVQPGDRIDFVVAPNAFDSESTAVAPIITFTPIPEPSTISLLFAGAIGLLAYGWRKCQTGGK